MRVGSCTASHSLSKISPAITTRSASSALIFATIFSICRRPILYPRCRSETKTILRSAAACAVCAAAPLPAAGFPSAAPLPAAVLTSVPSAPACAAAHTAELLTSALSTVISYGVTRTMPALTTPSTETRKIAAAQNRPTTRCTRGAQSFSRSICKT